MIDRPKKYLTIPHSSEGDIIKSFVSNDHIRIVSSSGMKLIEATRETDNNFKRNELSIVYYIPCDGCQRNYYRETSRGLTTRLYEHKQDLKLHRTSNALVQHIDMDNHLPDWKNANIIHKGINKSIRKALESIYIEMEPSTNSRSGFVTWSKSAAIVENRNWLSKKSRRSRKEELSNPT